MSETRYYTIVSYRPNGDDYCRGCHMASSRSDFDLRETLDIDQAAGWVADKLMSDHKAKNSPEIDEWQVTILINGVLYGHDEDDDYDEAESTREEIQSRARLIFTARLDEEKQKKEAEQARLKEEADRKKEVARLAKIEHEKAEYLRLQSLYGGRQ